MKENCFSEPPQNDPTRTDLPRIIGPMGSSLRNFSISTSLGVCLVLPKTLVSLAVCTL